MGFFRRHGFPGRPTRPKPPFDAEDRRTRAGVWPPPLPPLPDAERRVVLDLLGHEHLMTLAVLAPDGGPRVMTVGFLNDGLDIYLVTGRNSDKLAAIRSDPRVAAAIRHEIGTPGDGLALAMRGGATEVLDPAVAERINQAVIAKFKEGHLYCPQQHSVAIIRIRPVALTVARARNGRSVTYAYDVSGETVATERAAN